MNKLSNKSIRSIRAKKVIFILTAMSCLFILGCMSASAINTNVNFSEFITKTETVLKTILILIGAGLALWGVVNLVEGYGNDNPGAKSQGIKQTMGGIGIILIGAILVPVLGTIMTNATR